LKHERLDRRHWPVAQCIELIEAILLDQEINELTTGTTESRTPSCGPEFCAAVNAGQSILIRFTIPEHRSLFADGTVGGERCHVG
jgi:hypothetical protein